MRRLATKTLIFWAYFLALFAIIKLGGLASWSLTVKQLLGWLAGALVGSHFAKFDQLLYVYFTRPEAPVSIQVRNLVKQGKFGQVWRILAQKKASQQLVFMSALFQVAWVVMAFFTISSTAGFFGKAMVMAIGLKLLVREWQSFLVSEELAWLFWQIKRPVSSVEQKGFLWLMTAVFILLSLMLV